jgi:hypothetical protein
MKTIAEKHEQLKVWFLYFIIGLLIFLIVIIWLKDVCKPVIAPEATLLPASQHRPVVGGEWLEVEERSF